MDEPLELDRLRDVQLRSMRASEYGPILHYVNNAGEHSSYNPQGDYKETLQPHCRNHLMLQAYNQIAHFQQIDPTVSVKTIPKLRRATINQYKKKVILLPASTVKIG